MRTCRKCHKRMKLLYFHTNQSKGKKWVPMLYYCFNCSAITSYSNQRKKIFTIEDINNDNRFEGNYHEGIIRTNYYVDTINDELRISLQKKLSKTEFENFKQQKKNEYCNTKMVKLYAIFRNNEGKQKWEPVFWYCPRCKKIVAKIENDNFKNEFKK